MAKQLRLDVAQLTDVGRKREHNEDNMAYVIPKDPQVMAKKGALFIVADGMGGHAAGEVASEIAVDTVSNVFYQDDSDDVAASLLHAIKRANASIHQRAAENMLRSGMGTTCVAAVLRGNIAYIANVGDSRAYLVRGGQVRQVSQDHSWVAEQVRAGLLTEDQARTHAQRNVITRNLGTLAEVEVDVFVENLEEGDSFVLCTDGLSGLVNDDEIRRIVHDFVPQESVYHLVERANENGGPDNITAIVVRVAEVGAEVNGVRPPARVGAGSGREAAEASIVSMPTSPMAFASPSSQRSEGLASSASTKYAAGSPSSSESTLSTTLPLSTKKRRGRLFFPTLILVLLIVAGAVGSGIYYFLNNRPANVDTSLANAQELIVEANASSSNDPASSLRNLSQAQKMLKDLSNQPLTQAQRQRTTSLLQQDITSSTGTAIKNYNRLFLINSLPCTNTQSTTLNAGSSNATPLNVITTNDDKGNTALYTLAQDNTLYQITNNTTLANQIRGTAPIIAASTNNTDKHVYLLMSQATNGQNPANYSIASLAVGQTKPDKSNPITATNLKNGLVPRLITAWNNDIYVVLTSANGGNSATVLTYQGNKLGTAPTQTTLSVNANIIGVTAYPNHQLFLLLSDGSIQSAQTGT
ncbi:MAG TPA: Stp1/IreP family PP2C-type Ser/Thr phosphatase, partial [Ktedonobacteraceae bacterium]|nr:Stp1/IreP family PP2C-type Ser/Thr phosphatase [Ktedonobacteraceae bacterium]